MNRYLPLALILFTALFSRVVHPGTTSIAVVTQNFETPDLKEVTRQGWNFIIGNDAFAEFSVVSGGIRTGKKCLAVDVLRLGQQHPWDIQFIKENIPVTPGKLYQYSLWLKGERGSEVAVAIETPTYRSMENRRIVLTGEWQQVAIEFVPEQGNVRLPVHFSFDESFGSVIYIDDIVLEQTN